MPRDAVSRSANVERNGGHKWVKTNLESLHVHEKRLVVHVERGEHGGHWGNAHVGEGEVQLKERQGK